jgi:hypothetical protein
MAAVEVADVCWPRRAQATQIGHGGSGKKRRVQDQAKKQFAPDAVACAPSGGFVHHADNRQEETHGIWLFHHAFASTGAA